MIIPVLIQEVKLPAANTTKYSSGCCFPKCIISDESNCIKHKEVVDLPSISTIIRMEPLVLKPVCCSLPVYQLEKARNWKHNFTPMALGDAKLHF